MENSCFLVQDYGSVVCLCISTHHSCRAKNRWEPDLSVDPLEPPSWMLNNDPQRESNLFSPVIIPSTGWNLSWAGTHELVCNVCAGVSWLPSTAFVCWHRAQSCNMVKLVNTQGFSLLSEYMWGRLPLHEAVPPPPWGKEISYASQKEKIKNCSLEA